MNDAEKIRKNIFKDFTKFLKDNKCYIQYRENTMHSVRLFLPSSSKNKNTIGFMYGIQIKVLYLQSMNPQKLTFKLAQEFINYAFSWSDTPQGHTYWSRLSDKWRNFICKHYSQYISLLDD